MKKSTFEVEIREMLPRTQNNSPRYLVRVTYIEGNASWDYRGAHDLGMSLNEAQHYAFKIHDAIRPELLK